MGFLDKLLGRGKKLAGDTKREAGEMYNKGRDALDRDDEGTRTGAASGDHSPTAPSGGTGSAGSSPSGGSSTGAGGSTTGSTPAAGDSSGTGGGGGAR